MIKIAISVEAFEAICATLPFGSVGYENEVNERGERYVWLEDAMADRLGAMRGPGESYSDEGRKAHVRAVLVGPSGAFLQLGRPAGEVGE
jgi:hypothetical protein